MSIKQFSNPTSGFRNVFNRAQQFDSTGAGLAAEGPNSGITATGGITGEYTDPTGDILSLIHI